MLERKVAKVGLVTTRGFRDTLELGRRTRPRPYGMTGTFEPLIPRERRIEIDERMNASGEVVVPLDEAQLEDAVARLLAMGCESLVIHFLHAYANPAHELRAGEIARALWPNDYVTLGHALLSEFREYERGTTASVNAAVQPILDRYVRRLQGELEAQGFKRDLLVMNGNGGTVAARLVAREAAKTIMSGPASGVMAAAATLGAVGRGQRHHLRHGRHLHRRGADPRRRAAGLLRARHRLRPADPRADGGREERRRRRRLDRLASMRRACCRSGRSRRARSPGPSATAAAAPSPPSPTPTWCSAGSIPSGLLAVARPRDGGRGARGLRRPSSPGRSASTSTRRPPP